MEIPVPSATTQYPNGGMDAHSKKEETIKKLKSCYSVLIHIAAAQTPLRKPQKCSFFKCDAPRRK
jgi:hypothetical protein